jgi:hypothetical protein
MGRKDKNRRFSAELRRDLVPRTDEHVGRDFFIRPREVQCRSHRQHSARRKARTARHKPVSHSRFLENSTDVIGVLTVARHHLTDDWLAQKVFESGFKLICPSTDHHGGCLLRPTRGTMARRNGFIQRRGGRVFGQPSGPQDRTQPTKLEIPFGHAFDRREVSSPKSAVRTVAKGHFKPAHCRIVPDMAAASGASRVSGRTATDCGFAARCMDLPFRRDAAGFVSGTWCVH